MKTHQPHSSNLSELGLEAMNEAAKAAFADHAKSHDPVIMFEDGKVVEASPEQFLTPSSPAIVPPAIRKAS